MPPSPLEEVLRYLRRSLGAQAARDVADGELLARFVDAKDESAAAVLVERHGPMVFGVCRRVLGDVHDAEDAFQATFLVLARKAASLSRPERLGNWLDGVAYPPSPPGRAGRARRAPRGGPEGSTGRPPGPTAGSDSDLRAVLDGALSRLREKYRVPVVLCELEGRRRQEVAELLHIPEGTLSFRLAAARKLLARRLARSGAALATGGLAA